MIDTSTVFIIGAGASFPYGYPTGAGLRSDIITKFVSRVSSIPQEEGKAFNKNLLNKTAEEFVTAFRKANIKSIDRFLSLSPDYKDIGKLAIIVSLLEHENKSAFGESSHLAKEDWYSYLFERMTEDFNTPESFSRFKENKVSFITFNYDRSLEHFLYESLLHAFKSASADAIKEQVKSIPIHHVYGKVCPLPWEDEKRGLKYQELGGDTLMKRLPLSLMVSLQPNIKLIHERSKDDNTVAANLIIGAERIFFLGFGYAKENIDILSLKEICAEKNAIWGTAVGLFEQEIGKIRRELLSNAAHGPLHGSSPFIYDEDCLRLLRRFL